MSWASTLDFLLGTYIPNTVGLKDITGTLHMDTHLPSDVCSILLKRESEQPPTGLSYISYHRLLLLSLFLLVNYRQSFLIQSHHLGLPYAVRFLLCSFAASLASPHRLGCSVLLLPLRGISTHM